MHEYRRNALIKSPREIRDITYMPKDYKGRVQQVHSQNLFKLKKYQHNSTKIDYKTTISTLSKSIQYST